MLLSNWITVERVVSDEESAGEAKCRRQGLSSSVEAGRTACGRRR